MMTIICQSNYVTQYIQPIHGGNIDSYIRLQYGMI